MKPLDMTNKLCQRDAMAGIAPGPPWSAHPDLSRMRNVEIHYRDEPGGPCRRLFIGDKVTLHGLPRYLKNMTFPAVEDSILGEREIDGRVALVGKSVGFEVAGCDAEDVTLYATGHPECCD
jgi:hypothetical protein